MPPIRRRPVPIPPTTRPRVAGLRKRAAQEGGAEAGRSAEPTGTEAGAEAGTEPQTLAAEHSAAGSLAAADAPAAEFGTADLTPAESPAAEPPAAEPPAAESSAAESSVGSLRPAEADELVGATEPTGFVQPDEPTEPDGAAEPVGEPVRKPTPRRRRAAEGVPTSVLADEPAAKRPGTGSGWVLPVALLVLAALLTGLGAWFQVRADRGPANQALVDSGRTTEVAGQAREAVEKAFSYNFADVSSTERAAAELLTGKAKCQYDAIFGPVRTLAPEQKLVVTVKAVSSGVTSLEGDRATVLLFLDQVTTRTTDNQSGGGIAMMRVGAQRADGRWKVDNMEMFGHSGERSAELAKCQ